MEPTGQPNQSEAEDIVAVESWYAKQYRIRGRVAKMHSNGYSVLLIAKELKIQAQRVMDILRNEGHFVDSGEIRTMSGDPNLIHRVAPTTWRND